MSFAAFSSVSVDDVINAVRQLPDKSSAADPMPTSVMKQVVHLVVPYFAKLFNRSLAAGHFPSEYKEAFITPIFKKAEMDTTDVSSYRPTSNLSVVSKLLECIVVRQLIAYLSTAKQLRSDAIRSTRCTPITHHPSAARCAAGISSGTTAVHFAHLRPHSID